MTAQKKTAQITDRQKGAAARAGPFAAVEDAVAAIRRGEMVIVVDDEDRENEGDLTMAAEKVTPAAINFMAKHGRGLICLPMTGERLDELEIPLMVAAELDALRDRVLRGDRGASAARAPASRPPIAPRRCCAAINPEDQARRSGAARPHVSAARARRRRAGARRPDRGGRRPRAHRRA